MSILNPLISEPLQAARQRLYSISGGSADSGDVKLANLTTAQRTQYFQSDVFRDWVAYEKSHGRQVFWLKDVDKTQAAGDIFTFFFKWRADYHKFTDVQLGVIRKALLQRKGQLARNVVQVTRRAWSFAQDYLGVDRSLPSFAELTPYEALRLWQEAESGRDGLDLLSFWSDVYWPSQVGMMKDDKLKQVADFAPQYAARIYPGVPEENRALAEAGVEVVIVTNGDQELAGAAAPLLGIKPENVVGSHLIYDGETSTGENHSYEVFAEEWARRPQPGKPLSFHYWMHTNRKRWGWDHLDEHRIVIAGRDGDSASSDGGMMILLPTPAIGNFMINTPGEPGRIEKFHSVASKYGWTKGQFFTLHQLASVLGAKP